MLGILCGLESEARIARKIPGALVACAAARPGKARVLAKELIERGATALMSFGIAGALDPVAKLGDLFIGSAVTSVTAHWECGEKLPIQLTAALPQARYAGIYGSETLVATVAEKKNLFDRTGCCIVDMESQCVAEVASEAGIPFAVVRAVCDDASMHVPEFVMQAIRPDGSVNHLGAILHLARHPAQIPDLFEVMRGTGKALATLREAAPFIRLSV